VTDLLENVERFTKNKEKEGKIIENEKQTLSLP